MGEPSILGRRTPRSDQDLAWTAPSPKMVRPARTAQSTSDLPRGSARHSPALHFMTYAEAEKLFIFDPLAWDTQPPKCVVAGVAARAAGEGHACPRAVLSSFEWPRSSCTARTFFVRRRISGAVHRSPRCHAGRAYPPPPFVWRRMHVQYDPHQDDLLHEGP